MSTGSTGEHEPASGIGPVQDGQGAVEPGQAASVDIAWNLAEVRRRIARAAAAVGRAPEEVRLMAASKMQPVAAMRRAMDAGQMWFGENYVQELVMKRRLLGDAAEFALIGHLQSNKINAALGAMNQLHTLDSVDLAEKLDRRLQQQGRGLDVLVEVNTSGEPAKAGVPSEELLGFVDRLAPYQSLRPRGLMTVAANTPDEAVVAGCFDELARLRRQLREEAALGSDWPELSMGMSADFELAIAHGATIVRVGTAIFGPRPATS